LVLIFEHGSEAAQIERKQRRKGGGHDDSDDDPHVSSLRRYHITSVQEFDQPLDAPDRVRQSSFHRRRDTHRLMHAAEIVGRVKRASTSAP